MHDQEQWDGSRREPDSRCFSCGQWGWDDEVGEAVALTLSECESTNGGIKIPDTAPKVSVCSDCAEDIFRRTNIENPDTSPLIFHPDVFDAFVNNGCVNDGAFKFEHISQAERAGFRRHSVFQDYFVGHGGIWELEREAKDQLDFCTVEENFQNMIDDIVRGAGI